MPRGQPDFGAYAVKEYGATLADLADLAVRLGSIVEYDRRGDVSYLDDCEDPIIRFRDASSDDCAARKDTTVARSGGQSILLATDGTRNRYARADYYLSPMVVGKHGVKISFSPYELGDFDNVFRIIFAFNDGKYYYNGGVEIKLHDQTIAYLGTDLLYHIFVEDFTVSDAYQEIFHNAKLVFDIDTAKYIRLMLDVHEWDLSAYSFYKLSSEAVALALVQFQLMDLEGHAFTAWLDDFVYTINEP